jgi:hypothetical protein
MPLIRRIGSANMSISSWGIGIAVCLVGVLLRACAPTPSATPIVMLPTGTPAVTPYDTAIASPISVPTSVPTRTPARTATDTAVPTVTCTPTATDRPTATRTSTATRTPAPTETPVPTPSPTAGLSQEAQSCLQDAAVIIESYRSSLSDLATLAEAASKNPLLVLNGRWRSDIAACLATLKANGDKVRELSSPPECEEAHGHLMEASQHIDRGAELASDAMTRLDTAKIQKAVTEMQLGYEALNTAEEELQKLQK